MAFTCPECGRTSHHPEDERNGYCGNCHKYVGEALTVWVIYGNPSDYPGHFVVRPQYVRAGGVIDIPRAPTAVVETLDLARSHIPPGLVRFLRDPDDDPTIVETWL